MLVLSRKLNQSLMIGDDVKITVVGINGTKVKIGIQAPLETPVHRQEIYDAIKQGQADRQ